MTVKTRPNYLDSKMCFMPIFAQRHNLCVESDRDEVHIWIPSKFGIQNSNYEIDHFRGGEREILVYFTPSHYEAVRPLEIHFYHKMTNRFERQHPMKVRRFQSMTTDQG